MSEHSDYKRTLQTAASELSSLIEEVEELDARRDKITSRIVALREMVFAMSNVVGEDPKITYPELFPELIEPETGFTDAVREVLKSSNKYFSPVDIRDTLLERGFFVGKSYRNPLAAIHQILKRLVGSKEIEPKDENTKLYRWKKIEGTPLPAHGAGGGGLSVRRGSGGDPKPVSPFAPTVSAGAFVRTALEAIEEMKKKDEKK